MPCPLFVFKHAQSIVYVTTGQSIGCVKACPVQCLCPNLTRPVFVSKPGQPSVFLLQILRFFCCLCPNFSAHCLCQTLASPVFVSEPGQSIVCVKTWPVECLCQILASSVFVSNLGQSSVCFKTWPVQCLFQNLASPVFVSKPGQSIVSILPGNPEVCLLV